MSMVDGVLDKKIVGVIPARYSSSRLPGKPLKDICGKAMIHHVWDICINAVSRKKVVVLTDDHRIKNYCIKNEINYSMSTCFPMFTKFCLGMPSIA